MAKVYPFRALRYDPRRIAAQKVVTQPYDKITPELQERYYAADPHNLVRIELGKKSPQDNEKDNVYTRAAAYFGEWRRERIFQQDAEPSYYAYAQRFVIPGTNQELERRGFIGLGRIEDYSAGVVFRHEQTLARPKADRLELLRATRAHFGQLFMLYSDPGGTIEGLLSPSSPPQIEVNDEYGVRHQIWKISDPDLIRRITGAMADKKLIIADGHHRYETALAYRNERRAAEETVAIRGDGESDTAGAGVVSARQQDLPYDRVMMTFVNMDNPGLVILPTHRVVHGLSSFHADALLAGAAKYFDIEEIATTLDENRAREVLRDAGERQTALLVLTGCRAFLFRAKPGAGTERMAGLSPRQQALDVVKLHKLVLEAVLGMSEADIREQKYLTYLRDSGEAIEKARGGANAVFLMNPVRIEQVRDIAFAGEVLPQKSTDFYPKLLSGLTIYALD
jgi:uncharacterized protein (DUF1015 family)